MIRQVTRTSIYEEIINQLVVHIKQQHWMPGEQIPGEIELARRFNVSRNSIREALKGLEMSGILESKPGKGTFLTLNCQSQINRMELLDMLKSDCSLLDLFEVRLTVEPQLAYFAAKRANKEDIRKLEEELAQAFKAVEDNTYMLRMGFVFHQLVAEASKNKILIKFFNSIADELNAERFMMTIEFLQELVLLREQDQHKLILEYIKNGEADKAKQEMYDHVYHAITVIRPVLPKFYI